MAAVRSRHSPLLAARVVMLGLVVLGLVTLGLASGAQARHSEHHHHHLQDVVGGDSETQPRETGGIADGAAEIIRACADQAARFQKMPFDWVVETVQPNDDQRAALEGIRTAAVDGANKMNASCPKDVPALLTERLDTMRASLDAIKAALLRLRPTFVSAYALLSDEQKARLVARAIAERPQPGADPAANNRVRAVDLDCRQWPAMLKSWPLNRIEDRLELSDQQQAALYALMASIYRVAASLAASCHDKDGLTPVSLVDDELGRVDALRRGDDAIAPALAAFVKALNDEQNAQLNAILGLSPQPQTTAR
jgi:hypothetical protein